ncbi:MAG: hypothetical protein ACM32H_03975 [Candidatus Aminicenantes bacterium RBG_16_66_30]
MTLKKKMSWGLGFLFLIIFVLAIVCSYYIGELSRDAENILKDNYKSLVFAKNMIAALEETRTAIIGVVFNPGDGPKISDYALKLLEAGRTSFEAALKSENSNITEIHESEYVAAVNRDYALYANICLRIVKGEGGRGVYFNEHQQAFERLSRDINSITDLNMQAVERKSQMAKDDSVRIIRLMAIIAAFCLILAFGYFWYFPFYISNSIAYLSERMKTLLERSGITLDIKTNDEAFIILQGINLLESKLETRGSEEAR